MNEKDKYISLYQGSLSQLYCQSDARGRVDGGYGRAFWGQGMLEHLKALQPDAVLDVGCGYGRFCDAISHFVPQVYGADIASVKTGNVIDNPQVTFMNAEAKEIPLSDQAVDWVTSFDCLEHCPESDIDQVFREFDRIARKGFILSISYDPDYIGNVPLHMTVRPESWWIEKLSVYGKISKAGQVPLTGVPYLICEKPAARRLICYCVGGLGNRLRPLASCVEMSRQSSRELSILWREDDFRCQATFNELFENPMAVINDDQLAQSRSCKVYADAGDVANEFRLNGKDALRHVVERYGLHNRDQIGLKDEEADVIVYHNNFLSAVDDGAAKDFLKSLRPVRWLRETIDQLTRTLGIDKSVIGVHARGADFSVDVTRYEKSVLQALEADPGARILVCSDVQDYEDYLRRRFPDKTIVRPKSDWVRKLDPNQGWHDNTLTSKASVMEAVIDLYLLSRTNFLIYHKGSTFAQIAKILSESPPQWSPAEAIPEELESQFTLNGRIPVQSLYFDESRRNPSSCRYGRAQVESLVQKAVRRETGTYGITDTWLYQALKRYPIQGKRVAVIGSQVPFYEAVCIAHGAFPTTIEYEKIESGHPKVQTMTVDEFRRTDDRFDAAIAISTFEHTGLGRYGDPLEPEGDLRAMLLMRTRIKPGGRLFLSVPVGDDALVWNAHRIYGAVRLPLLTAGWQLEQAIGYGEKTESYAGCGYEQPIFVLRNSIEDHLEQLESMFRQHKTGRVFIETGTALGRGVKAALKAGFSTIYSIEIDDLLYDFNTSQFKDHPNVHILKGDSLEVLPHLLHLLEEPATFWLDAHRTGSGLNGGKSPYPLEQEIDIIGRHEIKSHTLIIDDRRLFGKEFRLDEKALEQRIRNINPRYHIRYADSTPEDTQAYGKEDVLVAIAEESKSGDPVNPTWEKANAVVADCGLDGSPRILYACPDVPIMSAGIRRLYRHVHCLTANGYDAAVLHQREGFRAPNQPDVPICYLSSESLGKKDIVVIPEGFPQLMEQLAATDCRRFVIALNWHYIFKTLPDNLDWRHFGIERVMVVSPIVGHLVSWAMGLPVHILTSGINNQLYSYDPTVKLPRICYIKRKAACISEVRKLLRSRNPSLVDDLEWVAMDGLTEQAYADVLRSSALFLNLSPAEGWMTSCLEAMRSGTLVAGYDSVGGRDLLVGQGKSQNAILAPNQDYMTLCLQLEPFLKDLLASNLQQWEHIRQNGLELATRMTMEAEEDSIIAFWKNIVDVTRQPGRSFEHMTQTEQYDVCTQ